MHERNGVLFGLRKIDIAALCVGVGVFLVLLSFVYPKFAFIGTDGVSYTLIAKNISQGDGLTLFGVPHTYFSPGFSIAAAPFMWIFDDIELAAHVATAFFSIGALVLLYLAVRMFSTSAVAGLATIFLATNATFVWTNLHPRAQTLAALLTGMVFLLLLIYANPERRGYRNTKTAFAIGAFSGLLYLVRPEYFFLIAPVAMFLLWVGRGHDHFRLRIGRVGIAFAGFALFALPYVIYLHNEIGQWTFSGRMAENYLSATYQSVDGTSIVTPQSLETNAVILFFQHLFSPSFMKLYLENLYAFEHTTLRVFGVIGISLFGIGVLTMVRTLAREYLAAFGVFASMILVFVLGHTGENGYITPFLFLFIIPIAIGCQRFVDEVVAVFDWKRTGRRALQWAVAGFASFYFAFVLIQNFIFMPPGEAKPMEYIALGAWFQEVVPGHESATILSRKPEVAFYAGTRWKWIAGSETPDELVRALNEPETYLAVDTRALGATLAKFISTDGAFGSTTLELLHTEVYEGRTIRLYRANGSEEI